MLDHMILTVSNVECSLAFYEAALKPLHIKFFLPYKGEGNHPDLWGFGDGRGRSSGSNKESLIRRSFTGGSSLKTRIRSMNSSGRQYPLVPETIFHRGHEWNTIRDTTRLMYLTRTDIRSKLSTKASDGTSTAKELQNRLGYPFAVHFALCHRYGLHSVSAALTPSCVPLREVALLLDE